MSNQLTTLCSVGGNAVSAFLSWRLSATNACDVTLVWKSGFDAVAHYGIFPTYSAYTASKMAALRMSECFQAENRDVRFVSLQPGGVDTEMYAKFHMPEDEDHGRGPGRPAAAACR